MVWNDNLPPSERTWPKLHVPVLFIKSKKNSLNNRFIPYAEVRDYKFILIAVSYSKTLRIGFWFQIASN